MAHLRKRYILEPLNKLLHLSPLVGILGHRQVGKTTLLEGISEAYHVLDLKPDLELAKTDPSQYIKKHAGSRVALDEVQLVPDLFPALKEWVRKHKKPGQFILSGSVRFTSRDAIRESLTGRIMFLELLPFSVAELDQAPLPDFCVRALQAKNLVHLIHQRPFALSKVKKAHMLMSKFLVQGGLPGICFIRDQKSREQKTAEQLLTILDRDLRLVKKIQVPFVDIQRLAQALARAQGEPLDYTRLKRESGISVPSIKKILFALEAVFLIRTIPIEGSTRGSTIFFEDVGEARILAGESLPSSQLEQFLYCDIRTQFQYRIGENVRAFQYLTRGEARVPICFRSAAGTLGIIPLASADAALVSGTIKSFLSAYGDGKLLLLHPGLEPPRLLHDRALLAPIGYAIYP